MKESDTPSVAPVPGAHTHTCLRCKKDFACLYPGVCMARRDVLPNLVVRLNNGGIKVIPHCVSPYKGYTAIVEYDRDSGVIFGTVRGIRDVVTFEADSDLAFERAFHDSVDDYLAMCAEHGEEPNEERIPLRDAVLGPEKSAAYAAAQINVSVAPVGGTAKRLAAIEARAKAATPGPWEWTRTYEVPDHDTGRIEKHWAVTSPERERGGRVIWPLVTLSASERDYGPDMEFVAHARSDVPFLLAALRSSPPTEPSDDFRLRPAYAHPINATEPSRTLVVTDEDVERARGVYAEHWKGFGDDRSVALRRVLEDYASRRPAAPPTEVTDGGEFEELIDTLLEEYRLYINAVIDSENPNFNEDYTATAAARTALIEYEKRIRGEREKFATVAGRACSTANTLARLCGVDEALIDAADEDGIVEAAVNHQQFVARSVAELSDKAAEVERIRGERDAFAKASRDNIDWFNQTNERRKELEAEVERLRKDALTQEEE